MVKNFDNELSHLWVVSDGNNIIGSSTYAPARDKSYDTWGEIISIYLLPAYFHKGIGTNLLHASMNELFSMGYSNIYLWVLEGNHSAREFYDKNGFKFNGDKLQLTIGGRVLNEIRYIFQKSK